MDLRSNLLAEANRYCADNNISLSRLATIVAKDGKFFCRIEAGGDCTTGMYERFMNHFKRTDPGDEAA